VAKKSKADAAAAGKVNKTRAGGRSTSSKIRKSSTRKKSAIIEKGATKAPPIGQIVFDLTDDQISMRAYFISERRRRLDLPGDANSDWLEAKRQLLAETRR
jgi:hypothetical protein